MKDFIESAASLVGDLRLLLFISITSAIFLYFPRSLVPADAATVVESYHGLLWVAMVIGISGLAVRLTLFLMALSNIRIKAFGATRMREREIAQMGKVLRSLTKEETALVLMFPSTAFHPIAVETDHPVVRSLRYKKVIKHAGAAFFIGHYTGFDPHEITEAAQAYLERHPDLSQSLDPNEALQIANLIMRDTMAPFRGVASLR